MSFDDHRIRKRERDKENQRLKREREKNVLIELERRNASLERQVKELSDIETGGSEHSMSLRLLQARNKALEERLSKVDDFVKSWSQSTSPSVHIPSTLSSLEKINALDVNSQLCEKSDVEMEGAVVFQRHPDADQQDHDIAQMDFTSVLRNMLTLPSWRRLPAMRKVEKVFDPFGHIIVQLRTSGSNFYKCPAIPQTTDLFHGASQNDLATATFRSTSQVSLRLPAKLAISSMHYRIARWMIEVSEQSFNQIPVNFHPTTLQLIMPHAPVFDYVIWPQMRDNFIKYELKYCQKEVLDKLYLAYRVRASIDADWIDPTKRASPIPQFLDDMSVVENWGLVDTFWTDYPELVESLDRRSVMVSD